ncbi:MAG: alpha/beta hydrolase [Desulfobacteraceae bacterium]|nr:MAG: alpha/beta hydrolase [Desulfobacteraceae bacterium]
MRLIFIHGSGGCKEAWTCQTAYFPGAEAINLPGHPHGKPCPTVDEYVEWLRDTLQPAGSKDLVLAGHSLGGAIAILYALKYPTEVKGLITLGSGARLRVSPLTLEGLAKALQNPDLFSDFLRPALSGVDPELREIMFKRMAENGPAVMLNDFKACDCFDVMDRLAEIGLPALALCGSEDTMTPPKYSQFLARCMPDCRVVIIPGGTHNLAAEIPGEVNRVIQEFLDSLSHP